MEKGRWYDSEWSPVVGKDLLLPELKNQSRILMGDLFRPGIPVEYIDRVFSSMGDSFLLENPQKFLLVTDFPEQMFSYLSDRETLHRIDLNMGNASEGRGFALSWPLPNVWTGIRVHTVAEAIRRIPWLLKTPSSVRWVWSVPSETLHLESGVVDACSFPNETPLRKGWLDFIDWMVIESASTDETLARDLIFRMKMRHNPVRVFSGISVPGLSLLEYPDPDRAKRNDNDMDF